jgi:hypothetical protein
MSAGRRLAAALLGAALVAAPAFSRGGAPPDIAVEPVPIFGAAGQIAAGWNEVLVRIQNNSGKPARGEVEVLGAQFSHEHVFRATAPYSAGTGTSVHVRVPVEVPLFGDVQVRVFGEGGEAAGPISDVHLNSFQPSGVILVDVAEVSRVRSAINEALVAPLFIPYSSSSRGSTPPTVSVVSPRFDPATGDPMLPDRAALYSSVDAVLIRSDVLTRIAGAELDALSGYVLAGGTLAITVARPEDIRHPTLIALAGGAITKRAVSSEALKPLTPAAGTTGYGASASKAIPFAAAPQPATGETLAGYYGGNLHGSLYGTTAAYGLGEVHLLAFDPSNKPAVDDPWAQARMVDIARRAFDRRSTLVFRPGAENNGQGYARVRQQLDPNQSSRWAIGVAALLLCLYAVFAGPVNFSLASKKGRPLRALRHLPIYAAATFAIIVAIGVGAKGVSGRARHLTLVEAGGGMTKGSARRFRGFFASRAKELTVRTTDGSSAVSTAVVAESADRQDHLVVDREGARLTDVAALPWQTVVVREDGFASLGDGIALAPDGATGVSIVNRTGRDLRGVIFRQPDGAFFYAARLKDGDKLSSSTARAMGTTPDGSFWQAQVLSTYRAGALDLHRLSSYALRAVLEPDSPGLGDAWGAMEEAAGDSIDWFPDKVPVLFAQIDGGEGRTSDSGLRLESDRLLVRVVGFGGKP